MTILIVSLSAQILIKQHYFRSYIVASLQMSYSNLIRGKVKVYSRSSIAIKVQMRVSLEGKDDLKFETAFIIWSSFI
jgi:hypothetical protein